MLFAITVAVDFFVWHYSAFKDAASQKRLACGEEQEASYSDSRANIWSSSLCPAGKSELVELSFVSLQGVNLATTDQSEIKPCLTHYAGVFPCIMWCPAHIESLTAPVRVWFD